jgi:hypothetical protein
VNLLQCKPGDYNVSNTYNMVKERLGSYITSDELSKLECAANEKELERQKSQSSSFFKIPIFQPTAAAAMFYNMQNATIKKKNIEENMIKNEVDGDRGGSKLYSYNCQQCKRDVWLCDTQTQVESSHLNTNEYSSINVFDVNECNNKNQQYKLWTDVNSIKY